MELADLKRRALASRETQHSIEGRSFTLRVPTRHEMTVAVQKSRAESTDEPALFVIVRRQLLEKAVVAWTGVTLQDFFAEEGPEPQDFDPEAVPLLLDAKPDWAAELSDKLVELIGARNKLQDSAAKN